MKTPKPALIIVVLVVFCAMLYVIYTYKTRSEGFSSEIMAHFQNMSTDQKGLVCKTLNEQMSSYANQMTNATDEQKVTMQRELADLKKSAGEYGC
jgi:cell division protein FtsL